jgi:hypothetical protein
MSLQVSTWSLDHFILRVQMVLKKVKGTSKFVVSQSPNMVKTREIQGGINRLLQL